MLLIFVGFKAFSNNFSKPPNDFVFLFTIFFKISDLVMLKLNKIKIYSSEFCFDFASFCLKAFIFSSISLFDLSLSTRL